MNRSDWGLRAWSDGTQMIVGQNSHERVRFGVRTALFLSALACFIAAIWYMTRPG